MYELIQNDIISKIQSGAYAEGERVPSEQELIHTWKVSRTTATKALTELSAPLKAGYEHEQYVTSLINNIYSLAFAQKDFKTMQFLDWFIKEQGEEEKNAEDQIKKMKMFGYDAKGLYALNQELAARVYTPSATGPAM